jgi:hypothetical protein
MLSVLEPIDEIEDERSESENSLAYELGKNPG